ncbi:MAG: 4Fe-4S dicluster domain-containing protein [Anaerolineae bacterium]
MAEGLKIKPVRLQWEKATCTGCINCVIVCSERHSGVSAISRARILVSQDPLTAEVSALWCRQCNNAPCAAACPVDAIQFDPEVRAWIVDEDLCVGCSECVRACRFGAIKLDPVTDSAIKCDLCGGATRCVDICPAGALSVRGR